MKTRYFIVKGKNNTCSIYVRFWDSNRIDQKSKTGLSVKFSLWSDKKQQVKNNVVSPQKDFINNRLRNLETFLLDEYNIEYNSQVYIGSDWLKNKIGAFFGRANANESHKVYFISWIENFIKQCDTRLYKGLPIAKRTKQHYETTLNKLKSYEGHAKKKLRFSDIDLLFYRQFVSYCLTIERLNNNTIGGYITNIKMWCKNIDIESLPINNQYKHSEFATISNKTKDVYLSEDEINELFNYDFSYSERLENVRDNFIIGLRTGLRISDFMKLTVLDFKNDFIEIETKKTSRSVVIPMHNQIKMILQKRNGNLPARISDQKFNAYIKEICEVVGFNEMIEGGKIVSKKTDDKFFPNKDLISKNQNRKEYGTYPKHQLITSHTCRRSFASNLYGILPNMSIMAITGHTTESQFLKYIKITPREHAEKLKDLWTTQQV